MLEAFGCSDNPPAVAIRTWYAPAAARFDGQRRFHGCKVPLGTVFSLPLRSPPLDVSVSLSVCLISVCLFSAPRYYQERCLSPRSRNECTRSFASSSERDAEIRTTTTRDMLFMLLRNMLDVCARYHRLSRRSGRRPSVDPAVLSRGYGYLFCWISVKNPALAGRDEKGGPDTSTDAGAGVFSARRCCRRR